MTPLEWERFVLSYRKRDEAEAKRDIQRAWMTANWSRAKELPSLESILAPPVEVVELQDAEAARQSTFMAIVQERLRVKNERLAREKREAEETSARG